MVFGVVPAAAVTGILMTVTLGSEFAFMFWLITKGAWRSKRRDVKSQQLR
jgi:hypothetical protein